MLPRFILGFSLLLGLLSPSFAQVLDPLQFSPDTDWKVMETAHYDLWYPQPLESEALRLAVKLESTRSRVLGSMQTPGFEPRRYPLVLSNSSAISNAWVQLAPKRSVWYPNGFQDPGAGSWYDLLASHEIRHMGQFDQLNRGFTAAVWTLTGETGEAIVNNLLIPGWFYEGDAVVTETALTPFGRGRDPSFDMELKVLAAAGVRWSYSKTLFGSYRDVVPDHYAWGWLLSSHARANWGRDIWAKVAQRTAGRTWLGTAGFTAGTRYFTGLSPTELYQQAWDSLVREQKAKPPIPPPENRLGSKQRNDWKWELAPQPLPNGDVLVAQYDPDQAGIQILLRHARDSDSLVLRIPYNERLASPFSAASTRIAWSEIASHWRWGQESIQRTQVYDWKSNDTKVMESVEGGLTAPALSPDGKFLVGISTNAARKFSLVMVDIEKDSVVSDVLSPDNAELQAPRFAPDGKSVVLVRKHPKGNTLALWNLGDSLTDVAGPFETEIVSQPTIWNQFILYASSRSGVFEIWAWDRQSGERKRITQSASGAFHPSVSISQKLYWVDHGIDGLRMANAVLDPSLWVSDSLQAPASWKRAELLAKQEGGPVFTSEGSDSALSPVMAQSTFLKGLSAPIHSWYLLPVTSGITGGVTGENVLHSWGWSADVTRHIDISENLFHAGLSIAPYWPVLFADGKTGTDREWYSIEYRDENDQQQQFTYSLDWETHGLAVGVALPWSGNAGLWQFGATPQLSLDYMLRKNFRYSESGLDTTDLLANEGYVRLANVRGSAYWLRQPSARDLAPAGIQLQSYYGFTPWDKLNNDYWLTGNAVRGNFYARMINVRANIDVPLPLHANLNVRLGREFQSYISFGYPTKVAYLNSEIPLVRGFGAGTVMSLYSDFAMTQVQVPLLNPDLELGGLLYLKRVVGTLFYDNSWHKGYWPSNTSGDFPDFKGRYQRSSLGWEILPEFHPFRMPIALRMGIRQAILLDGKPSNRDKSQIEFAWPEMEYSF